MWWLFAKTFHCLENAYLENRLEQQQLHSEHFFLSAPALSKHLTASGKGQLWGCRSWKPWEQSKEQTFPAYFQLPRLWVLEQNSALWRHCQLSSGQDCSRSLWCHGHWVGWNFTCPVAEGSINKNSSVRTPNSAIPTFRIQLFSKVCCLEGSWAVLYANNLFIKRTTNIYFPSQCRKSKWGV